ncbi:YybH family protein [Monashia sp. NPDC004114]
MTTTAAGVPAPELLELRFAECVAHGDLDGILRLYAADAVVSLPRGREAAGHVAIRAAFAAALGAGALAARAPEPGSGGNARVIRCGDLAMTTSTSLDGTVQTQVARREADGSWVWVRDGSRLREVDVAHADRFSVTPETAAGGPDLGAEPVDEPVSGHEFGTHAAVA